MADTSNNVDQAVVSATATCARSGAFALLLSLALFTMTPYWLHRGEQIALVNYVTLRLSLAGAVETLDGSVNWKTYRASNPEADSMTIAELLKVHVQGAPVGGKEPQQVTGAQAVPKDAPGWKPLPPSNVTISITSTIDEMPLIADALVKLDDSQLLTKSRNVSIFYNNSIFRWAIKRQALLLRHAGTSSGGVVWLAAPDPNQPPNFVPTLGKDLLLNSLTVSDARELAMFELPQLSDTTSIGVSGEREIDVSPGSLPRTLFSATLCAEALLLFVIIYFGVFAREAASSESFPVAGTLFSAFAKSDWTLVIFAIMLFVPAIASLGIFLASTKWEFLLLTTLVGCATCWVFGVLQRKHYFGEYDRVALRLKGFLTPKRKMLVIAGCNHGIQIGTGGFAALDGEAANEQRQHFRKMLESICAENKVDAVLEENGGAEETTGQQLAEQLGIPWQDINTSNEDKERMGIPQNYVSGPYTLEQKSQWNQEREKFMATKVRAQNANSKNLLVICGFTHLDPLAELIRQTGTKVRKCDYRGLSWYRPGVFAEDP